MHSPPKPVVRRTVSARPLGTFKQKPSDRSILESAEDPLRKVPHVPVTLFVRALTTNVEHLSLPDDMKAVGPTALASFAMEVLDRNGDGMITLSEFQYGMMSLFNAWKSLRRSWLGHETVSRAYHLSTLVAYWLLSFAAALLVFRLSPTTVLLPLGTIAVATAFAIGGTVSSLVQALMFIVVYSPYEVGDKVVVEGVQGDSSMTVRDVSVTTTSFETGSGKRVQVANHLLAQKAIINLKKSFAVSVSLKFSVGRFTTGVQLLDLKRRVEAFMRRRPGDWRPEVSITVEDCSLAGPMVFSMSANHLKT